MARDGLGGGTSLVGRVCIWGLGWVLGCAASRPSVATPRPPNQVQPAATSVAAALPLRVVHTTGVALTDPQAQALWSSPEDAPSEHLRGVTREREGKHYVAGNEWGLRTFYPVIQGLGGGYVGVGAEQGYLLAGWMQAEVGWFIDYDPTVLVVHDIYASFFAASRDLETFLGLWKGPRRAEAEAALRAHLAGERLDRALSLYRAYRSWIDRRLSRLSRELRGVPSFLNDAAQYDFVRTLVSLRRVRPMQVDLRGALAMKGIADGARRLGVPIRVLYLSNAEEYWDEFPESYRENLRRLWFDERSVVLRTLLTWSENQDYRYNAQPAQNYVAWLAAPWLRNVRQISPSPRSRAEAVGASRPQYPFTFVSVAPSEDPRVVLRAAKDEAPARAVEPSDRPRTAPPQTNVRRERASSRPVVEAAAEPPG